MKDARYVKKKEQKKKIIAWNAKQIMHLLKMIIIAMNYATIIITLTN